MSKTLNVNYFKGLVVIDSPGKYNVKVRSVVNHEGKYIVGVDAIAASQQETVQQMLDGCSVDNQGNTSLSITDVPTLSGNIWANSQGSFDAVPVKGESVTVYVDYVDTKQGRDLRIQRIAAIPVNVGGKLNLSQFGEATSMSTSPADVKKEVEPVLVIETQEGNM